MSSRWRMSRSYSNFAAGRYLEISYRGCDELDTASFGTFFIARILVSPKTDRGWFSWHPRLGPICDPPRPTHGPGSYATVADVITGLPPLMAGQSDGDDAIHRAGSLSSKNLARIRHSMPGGTWRDWPKRLVTKCHRAETGRGYGAVYGRMEWAKLSPTITTQFYGFGSGRFGHPTQDRALSLREGAMLQSFPRTYRFVSPHEPVHFKTLGRLIGNAVPVKLARAIAVAVKDHLGAYK